MNSLESTPLFFMHHFEGETTFDSGSVKTFKNTSASEMKSKAHRRVLLVDDDRDFGALALNIAESYAIPMEYATSLDQMRPEDLEKFDAIILDYHLEDNTGMEVGHFLDTLDNNTPVVLTSGLNFWEVDPMVWPKCVRQFVPKNAGLSTIILTAYRLALSV